MSDQQRVYVEPAWGDDGHVSDVVITALADGERSLVPQQAQEHVEACDRCSRRLGEAALASLAVGEVLEALPEQALAPAAAAEPVRLTEGLADTGQAATPFPKLAITAALTLAALGAVPSVVDVGRSASGWPGDIVRGLPIVAEAFGNMLKSVAEHAAGMGTVLWCASVLLLLTLGLTIARLRPREAQQEEGT